MEAPPLERRLAAILAADVEGYSRLMHGDEESTMATLSARRAVVDELIAQHRGRIANTAGDSVLAEFTSILDAVRCAIEIQASLQRAKTSPKDAGCVSGSASMSATHGQGRRHFRRRRERSRSARGLVGAAKSAFRAFTIFTLSRGMVFDDLRTVGQEHRAPDPGFRLHR